MAHVRMVSVLYITVYQRQRKWCDISCFWLDVSSNDELYRLEIFLAYSHCCCLSPILFGNPGSRCLACISCWHSIPLKCQWLNTVQSRHWYLLFKFCMVIPLLQCTRSAARLSISFNEDQTQKQLDNWVPIALILLIPSKLDLFRNVKL